MKYENNVKNKDKKKETIPNKTCISTNVYYFLAGKMKILRKILLLFGSLLLFLHSKT